MNEGAAGAHPRHLYQVLAGGVSRAERRRRRAAAASDLGGPLEGVDTPDRHLQASYQIIAKDPEKWNPKTRETADHSMQYIVVASLEDGEVTQRTFEFERIRRPETLRRLQHEVSLDEDPELTAGYPEGIPNRIVVTRADGTQPVREVRHPRGHAKNPMSDDEVTRKYPRERGGPMVGREGRRVADAGLVARCGRTRGRARRRDGSGLMVWLTPGAASRPPGRLRAMLAAPRATTVPGVFNGLTALLARRAGASAAYLSGAALSASMGLPDIGLLTLDELLRAARQIVRVSALPLIVDADTGFGSALNTMRTVRELEDAGAAAVQIEDQVDPKRCGHLDGNR